MVWYMKKNEMLKFHSNLNLNIKTSPSNEKVFFLNVISCLLKMARLRLVLMVNYTEFRRMEQHEQIPDHQVQGS